jgi:thiamine-phosphate pyrophosphorylase
MSTRKAWQRGLYVITDTALRGDGLHHQVERAIAGGARLVQYRDKGDDPMRREREASTLLRVCHAHGVPLLINDDVSLAHRIGADGVHLGRDDAGLAEARRILGNEAIIGISCYDSLQRAVQACAAGADYVAFGRFFPSRSKPRATPADIGLLRRARARIDRPLVAIGGITAQNGRLLIEAGADMLAVIHGVFGAADVTRAAHAVSQLFTEPENP